VGFTGATASSEVALSSDMDALFILGGGTSSAVGIVVCWIDVSFQLWKLRASNI
jgi:hypothetical protein